MQTDQNCLTEALFMASESYSVATYAIDDLLAPNCAEVTVAAFMAAETAPTQLYV